jgi:hypothetical protein
MRWNLDFSSLQLSGVQSFPYLWRRKTHYIWVGLFFTLVLLSLELSSVPSFAVLAARVSFICFLFGAQVDVCWRCWSQIAARWGYISKFGYSPGTGNYSLKLRAVSLKGRLGDTAMLNRDSWAVQHLWHLVTNWIDCFLIVSWWTLWPKIRGSRDSVTVPTNKQQETKTKTPEVCKGTV